MADRPFCANAAIFGVGVSGAVVEDAGKEDFGPDPDSAGSCGLFVEAVLFCKEGSPEACRMS